MDRSHRFMELHHSLISTTVVTAIFFVIVITILLQILNKSNTGKLPPPRAEGAWPVIGHLHLLGGSQLPHKVLGDMSDKYGPIFTIKLGVHQALVVSNANIAKECFTTNDSIFASRPKSKAVEIMGYNYAMFGLGPYGDYWRQVRKIIMSEVLSARKVEMLAPVQASELRASVKELYVAWVKNKDDSKKSSSDMVEVEMKQWFGNLVLNILITIISGKRFSLNDEQAAGVRFQEAVRKFFELLGVFVVSDYIPYLKHLDLGGYEKAMKVTAKEMDDIIGGWLKDHKESFTDESGNQAAGFLDVLISILEGASKEDFPGFDNDTIVKATCLTLLSAGLDTTSVTLTWALSLLLNNPKALEIAEDEIDKHVGKDRLVQESDIKNLVYLNAIIKETLRLYPAVPLSVPHESMEDCIVGGYHVPKGTRLLVNLWKLHRDPNVWSDPNEFQPKRFLTSQKDIDVKGSNFELLPFGSGRRMCPGVSFSLQALSLTLASLIQQFVLKKPSNELVDMSESLGLTNSKATPLLVLLAPRLSLDMYHTTTA